MCIFLFRKISKSLLNSKAYCEVTKFSLKYGRRKNFNPPKNNYFFNYFSLYTKRSNVLKINIELLLINFSFCNKKVLICFATFEHIYIWLTYLTYFFDIS